MTENNGATQPTVLEATPKPVLNYQLYECLNEAALSLIGLTALLELFVDDKDDRYPGETAKTGIVFLAMNTRRQFTEAWNQVETVATKGDE